MSNPMLNDKIFSRENREKVYEAELVHDDSSQDSFAQERVINGELMSIQGTVSKILMLFVCLLAGAAISVSSLFGGNAAIVPSMIGISAFVAFILVLATCFNIRLAKYTAAPYALLEGICLGGISALFETQMQGIVLQAILGTFSVLFVMLMLFKAKAIQYTEKFAAVLKTSILSILLIYLIEFVASLFGRGIPGIFEAGIVGIGFSLFVVVIAAMSLIQDFAFIEMGEQNMLSKDYEWYGAMGLMITLVWLYLEILRLLAKMNSRR